VRQARRGRRRQRIASHEISRARFWSEDEVAKRRAENRSRAVLVWPVGREHRRRAEEIKTRQRRPIAPRSITTSSRSATSFTRPGDEGLLLQFHGPSPTGPRTQLQLGRFPNGGTALRFDAVDFSPPMEPSSSSDGKTPKATMLRTASPAARERFRGDDAGAKRMSLSGRLSDWLPAGADFHLRPGELPARAGEPIRT